MSPPGRVLVSLIAFVLGAPALQAAAGEAPRIVGDPGIADLALAAVDAYQRLDREFLGARLGEGFRFVEERRGPDRKLDAPGFLDMLPTIGTDYADRELDVEWVGVIPSDDSAGTTVDVRGRWRATEVASGRALSVGGATHFSWNSVREAREVSPEKWWHLAERRAYERTVPDQKLIPPLG